ncbi:GNAT family N-acetyltransferase [Roseimicrobium sp. ORNL1]|uniref:GNAT family N-acetyltransferase n=1 Tax=Roseimicrobium sp. ORNL1 TaxID=2711231 RepID=UPI0013E16310|nr:GNAT family N-acetyltransferase [Roseimicrobium sp. ORNL1]QIF02177.1 GNAT family N-acetyltransferase [Roseimicrobium sp. ORNL1]
MESTFSTEVLARPASDADITALAELLLDTVSSGAAVSFLDTLSHENAVQWWRGTLASAHPEAVFLVARDAEGIAGTVQLHPAWAPNQPHRAEIAKMMVHTRCRRMGLGRRLMVAIEEAAKTAGYRMLTLDTKAESAAEMLYRQLGWIHVGTIPRFAMDPDGVTPHGAAIFYKELESAA